MKVLSLVVLLLSLTGCANYFMRKTCDAINWYQHGHDIAMRGQRISNDDQVIACRKAEADVKESQLDQGFKAGMAQYCRPEIVLQTGKKGENFNLDLCDPGQGRILLAKHREGVKEFCAQDNGYQVGASGKAYNKICPPEMEKAFLKEYNRGRKKYLQAMVTESMAKSNELDRQVSDKDQQVRNLQYQMSLIPSPATIIHRNTSPSGHVSQTSSTEDSYAEKRRNIEWELNRRNSEADELRRKQREVREDLYKYQRELTTLE